MPFQVFWLWAPLHFGDRFTHLAFHEHEDSRRWLETALVLDPIPDGASACSTVGVRECHGVGYELEWEPGRREIRRAHLWFTDPIEGETHIEVEKKFTFRMRGIGYWHPHWSHGSNHGQLETGRAIVPRPELLPRLIGTPPDAGALTLEQGALSFGGVHAIDGLDLEIHPGLVHGLIGPNGSGKTTTLNVISGYYAQQRGAVRLNGAALPMFARHRL